MFRLIVIVVVIAVVIVAYRAFFSGAHAGTASRAQQPAIKGPDDDEEFLWNLEKERFKKRREKERLVAEEEAAIKRARQLMNKDESASGPSSATTDGGHAQSDPASSQDEPDKPGDSRADEH